MHAGVAGRATGLFAGATSMIANAAGPVVERVNQRVFENTVPALTAVAAGNLLFF